MWLYLLSFVFKNIEMCFAMVATMLQEVENQGFSQPPASGQFARGAGRLMYGVRTRTTTPAPLEMQMIMAFGYGDGSACEACSRQADPLSAVSAHCERGICNRLQLPGSRT